MVEAELEMSTRAYCKMLMHAAKYPSASINGLLLSPGPAAHPGPMKIKYVDCVPLFHINIGLAPMVEVALAQVESELAGSGLVISGFYHGHDNLRDNHVDTFSQKIADRICENSPGAATALVTIDSKKLSLNVDCAALIVQQQDPNGKWRRREAGSLKLEHDTVSLQCATAVIHKKIYRELVDFDLHLDDISLDYLNEELNPRIDSCL